MMSLFSYIFVKSHSLCVNFFKEKEFPEYFASGVIAIVVVGTITVTADVIGYLVHPDLLNDYGWFYKYFSLGSVLFSWWYLGYKKNYIIFVKRYEELSGRKRKVLSVVSTLYLLGLVISFFWLGDLMRDYNLGK
jgi:hypothetical protein